MLLGLYNIKIQWCLGFPGSSAGKESSCNVGDLGLIPELGRSPGDGNGYPFQYSGMENSMDCIVHGVCRVRHNWVTFTSLAALTLCCCCYCCLVAKMCPIPCYPVDCNMPGFSVLCYLLSLLKLTLIKSVMLSKYFILCFPLPLFPSIFPSLRVFSSELGLCIRWSK